jgi:hypothetical protein
MYCVVYACVWTTTGLDELCLLDSWIDTKGPTSMVLRDTNGARTLILSQTTNPEAGAGVRSWRRRQTRASYTGHHLQERSLLKDCVSSSTKLSDSQSCRHVC